MAITDLQWYPWNLNLLKNVENTVVFFNSKRDKRRNAQDIFTNKPQMNINSLKKQKHGYSWSDKALMGTVLSRSLPSLHEGSLKITLTVP